MLLSKSEILNDPSLCDQIFREWKHLNNVVQNSPVHFAVYDADDMLLAWNKKYEENHPEAFEFHRDEAEAGTLHYRQILRYDVEKFFPPEAVEAELDRRVDAHRHCTGEPVDRYYHSVGHIRVYKYKLDDGSTAGLAVPINDLVRLQQDFSDAHAQMESQYDEVKRLLDAQNDAAANIQRAEERYRSLTDSATDGITVLDIDTGRFVEDANPALERFFGVSRNEMLGKMGPLDFSPEFQPDGQKSDVLAAKYIARAYNDESQSFSWTHVDIKGNAIPCQVTLARFPDATRRLLRASIVDQTERIRSDEAKEELERQLARSQRLETIGQMTGGVAHDFNNLLSVLVGNLELLEERLTDPETLSIVKSAISAAEQGAGLTRSMLNYARQAPLKPETFRLKTVVQKMENLISRTLPARINFKTEFSDNGWFVSADPSTTRSAILNLVLNASDAMPNEGEIIVSTTCELISEAAGEDSVQPGRYVVLTVKDNGQGMSEELLDKIFEPFFTTKGIGQNSGLGLSMVQGFISQTGGQMRAESKLGEGTSMKLYFPAIAAKDVVTSPPVSRVIQVQGKSSVANATIMLIEDSELVSEIMQAFLRRQGHEVLVAGSTETALEVFSQVEKIDLLITDIAIPGKMQGPELAREFKKTQPDLPVIFISGYSFGLETEKAGLEETDLLLTKPVRQEKLLRVVNDVLSGRA